MDLRRIPLVFSVLFSLTVAVASVRAQPQTTTSTVPSTLPQTLPQIPPPIFPGDIWQSATPHEAGMDPRALATLLEYGSNVQMDSLFIARHGKVVVEAYYPPFARGMKHRINSATKAVVGALTGIAIQQRLLPAADATVLPLFPGRDIANVDDRKRAITLQSLLDMTSGIDWTEPLSDEAPRSMIAAERSGDPLRYILDQPMAQSPGQAFNYSSGNSHVLSALITQRSKLPSPDFAAQHLFAPIGIKDFRWRRDAQGVAFGGYGLYLAPADMARIGHLYLHRGKWNERQVIPEAWVDKVFNARVPMTPGGQWLYADGWWVRPDRKAYLMVGMYRQLVVVMPDLGIVAATNGRSNYPIENLLDHLRKAATPAGEADAQAAPALQQAVLRYASEPAQPLALPSIAHEVSGRRYKLEPNPFGWSEVMVQFGAAPTYEVLMSLSPGGRAVRSVRPLGVDGRFATAVMPDGVVLSSKAQWLDDKHLRITVRLPEEVVTLLYDIAFDADRIELAATNASGVKTTVRGLAAH